MLLTRAAIVLALAALRAAASDWYDTLNRAAIAAAYNNVLVPSASVPMGWTGNLTTGDKGTTSPAYRNAVLTRVNWFRALAGVPATVSLNPVWSEADQQAALMMMANQQLSHTPPTSWLFYTAAGAEAASKSNLCLGFISDPGCVQMYISDFGPSNAAAGHRRWLLYPQTTAIGTGDVQGTGVYQMANAMWVIDSATYSRPRPPTRDVFVAWPPPGYVPFQVVSPRWSFSYPSADFASAIVTMQRNGAPVPVRQEAVANGTGENSIVWVPDNQDANDFKTPAAPAQDTTTVVTVSNVLVNNTPRTFTYAVTIFNQNTSTSSPAEVRSDFNLDNAPDILWQDPSSGFAQVWLLGGTQGTSVVGAATLTASNTWRIVGVGDFDSDGHPDAVWQDMATGAAQVWSLEGSQGNVVTGAAVLSGGNAWRVRSIADFNSDGKPDVLWQDPVSGLAQIWFMGGAQGTTLVDAANLTASNAWQIAGSGDFNGDKRLDVVWQDPTTGAVQIWYLGGIKYNVVTGAATVAGASNWRIAAVADLNRDGHPDFIWQDRVTGASQVWFLGGAQGATTIGSAAFSGANAWRIVGPR